MEEKFTAAYVMVRKEELSEADKGSYEVPLERQKRKCREFFRQKFPEEDQKNLEVYTNLNQVLIDVERRRIKRLIVRDLDRLGATPEDRDGVLFELRSGGVEILTTEDSI